MKSLQPSPITPFCRFIFLIVGALLISSCTENGAQKSTGSTGVDTSRLMPLEVGNVWQFISERYDDVGAMIDQTADSIYVAKRTTVLDQEWYEVVVTRSINGAGTVPLRYWWTNGDDGVYDSYDWKADPPLLLFKYPSLQGVFYYSGHPGQTVAVAVTAADSIVTIGRDRYRVWIYDLSTQLRWTFAPGVGPVRIETIEYLPPTYHEHVRTRTELQRVFLAE